MLSPDTHMQMHSMYFTRVVIICTYTSGYNTQYTIQTNPTDIYVIMHSCLRMFTGEHVKPVSALREDSCITNTPYIQYIDFITMLRFKFTFLLTFDIPPLPPRSQQFSFGEICSQKDCEKLEKMRSQDAKKTLFSSPGCGADRQTSVSASAHREEKIESDC